MDSDEVARHPELELEGERARLYLASLGNNAKDVAAALEALGALGEPRSPRKCPLSYGVAQAFPGLQCRVYDQYAVVQRQGMPLDGPRVHLPLPRGALAFVRRFDGGGYTHLIEG